MQNTILGTNSWSDVDILDLFIKDDVWISFNSIILKGITTGQGAVIAADSIIKKNIPDNTLYGGIPSKFLKN